MDSESKQTIFVGIFISLMSLTIIIFLVVGWQWFKVFSREQSGKAELAQATWSRRIAVEEAKAKRDSAKLEGEAEVARAEGLAEANHIIGGSLRGQEEYLRYLWITKLEAGNNKEVIYVPTEAGIPILEATRLP